MSGASKPTRSVRLRTPSPSKRASILRAARELVTGVGFRDTQMNAVAETAGVALGTLYRNFPSKAELMVEVVADVAQREVDAVAKVATENGTAAERLSASAWLFASRALLGRKLAHALVAEPVEPEIKSARLKYRRKLARVFEGIIEQGFVTENFPSRTFKPPPRASSAPFSKALSVPWPWTASRPQSVNARPRLLLPSACEARAGEWRKDLAFDEWRMVVDTLTSASAKQPAKSFQYCWPSHTGTLVPAPAICDDGKSSCCRATCLPVPPTLTN